MATTSTAQTGGHRHNTLAHMAAIAQRTGPSSTPLPRVSQGETEDILEVADVLTDLEVPEISVDPGEPAAVPEEAPEFESTLLLDRYELDDIGDGKDAEAQGTPEMRLHPAFNLTDPLLREYVPPPRPQPMPAPDLVIPVAVVEAGLAAVSALFAAMLLLMDSAGAAWPLALAMIAGLGSWVAYGMARETSEEHQGAGAVLLVSQLGMLAWSMALVGPRVSLLLLIPGVLLLALRMTSRAIAAVGAVLSVAIYSIFLWLQPMAQPGLSLSNSGYAVLDVALVIFGMGLLLVTALNLHTIESKALHLARIQRQELRQVRAYAKRARLQSEDEDMYLQEVLAAMLYDRGDWSSRLDLYTGPLKATAEQVGERLAMLRGEREERQSLEAAVLSLTRAVERAWLGLPWAWPAPSSTSLDELVALLRTPNPRETELEDMTYETMPFVPIPSGDPSLTAPPWVVPTQHPRVHQHLSDPNWSFADIPAEALDHHPEYEREAAPGGVQSDPSSATARRVSPLPWLEWDEWRNWDERFSS
jgi:hypothetical protein